MQENTLTAPPPALEVGHPLDMTAPAEISAARSVLDDDRPAVRRTGCAPGTCDGEG